MLKICNFVIKEVCLTFFLIFFYPRKKIFQRCWKCLVYFFCDWTFVRSLCEYVKYIMNVVFTCEKLRARTKISKAQILNMIFVVVVRVNPKRSWRNDWFEMLPAKDYIVGEISACNVSVDLLSSLRRPLCVLCPCISFQEVRRKGG